MTFVYLKVLFQRKVVKYWMLLWITSCNIKHVLSRL